MAVAIRVRRYNRRPRRARRYGKRKTNALRGFTKQQTISLKRAIGRSEETKYQATVLCANQGLDPAIHTPGTDCLPLVPKILAGTGENQRVGRRVTPVRCKVDVNVSFTQSNLGLQPAGPPAYQSYAQHIYVVMFIVRSKSYKNYYQWSLSQNWQNLLDNGDGTSVPFGYEITPSVGSPFWTADTRSLQKPIETSEYTLIRKKVVKLTKNVGMIDSGITGQSQMPNLPSVSYRGSFSYKLPALEWDDTQTAFGSYPTNANVMLMVGWCYGDNLGTYYFTGENVPSPPDSILSLTATNHIFFKDG